MSLFIYTKTNPEVMEGIILNQSSQKAQALHGALSALWHLRLSVPEVQMLFRAVAAKVGELNRRFDGEKWRVALIDESPAYEIRIYPESAKSNSKNFIMIIYVRKMSAALRAWEIKALLDEGERDAEKGGYYE